MNSKTSPRLFAPFVLLAFSLLATGWTLGATVKRTFSGVITLSVTEGAIAKKFPAGTPWVAQVEWESTTPSTFLSDVQARYQLKKFTLTFQSATGKWTTSSLPGKGSFGFNYLFDNTQHEMQFNSGWGPESHSNKTIENYQPYSINIVLNDPTAKAVPALSPAPSTVDLGAWSAEKSYFKLYLTSDGSKYILGSVKLPTVAEAEISVQEPAGNELIDGTAKAAFGPVPVKSKSATKTFIIHNTGKARLTKLGIVNLGNHKGDFIVSPLSATSLAPGAKARFTVTFKPRALGKRNAAIRIASNDKDENPFDIKLVGFGR